ncbi:ABC transporter ATP-binding protein [Ruficoccus amylovorans]|uniref:ABC transporter ATP-binding protein n=1 Tax=Ruficoccus amylovorans TaxID=1804625 RepID=A0A842HCY0_9BACT|nr:ABC transporter ATP-binding protein [Ruficoccus amylovorans]MBC2594365.1 ABC transporter ATP-binding protein [Ruficoccus amylovorans]
MNAAAHPPPGRKEPGLIEFIWSERKRLGGILVLTMIRSLAIAPIPMVTKAIIDHALAGKDIGLVFLLSGVILALIALHMVFARGGNKLVSMRIPTMLLDLRARIFHKLQFMHFGFLDRTKTGRLLSKYAFDTQQVEGALIPIINTILPELLYAGSLIVILIFISPLLSAVIICVVPLIFVMRWLFMKRIMQTNRNVRLARERLTGAASEYISALRLVRSLGEEQAVHSYMDTHSEGFREGRERQILLNQNFGTFSFVSTEVLSVIVIALSAILVITGHASIGTLVAFQASLPIILRPINQITAFSQQYYLGQESYRSICELLDSGYVEKWTGDYTFKHLRGEITFEDVSFAYEEGKPDVLQHFSLTVKPGEHVAFVGPSGSGKSTLVSLILGVYAPREGRILIDGMPQERIAMRAFRRNCAIVMQDSLLLSGTITDNIRFGRPDATEEEVREAARLAYADGFIEQLDQGYETKVGERGVSLSGGQRQRISIARALLRNPRILILDEATSALDYESERQVQAALANLAEGRTVITIAHRLSTVREADRIVVLHKGVVKESGSFEELAKLDGFFAHLLAGQNNP